MLPSDSATPGGAHYWEENMTRWLSPFDGMEELAFKPVAEGYIYRAPNPWLIGRGRHYIVSETQKSEIAIHHRHMMRALFWAIVVGSGSAGSLSSLLVHEHGWQVLAISAAVGIVIGMVGNTWLACKIRPIIATLTPTSERISQYDVLKRQTAVYPFRFTVGFGVLSLVMLALAAARGAYGPEGWDLYAVLGTVLFSVCTLYWMALYMAKRRAAVA
jgi:hypothetical protein